MKANDRLGVGARFAVQIRFAVYLVTFLFAVTVASAQSVTDLPLGTKMTEYCSLLESGTTSRPVETEAFLYIPVGGTQRFVYSTECNGPDNFSAFEFDGRLPKSMDRYQIFRIRFRAMLEIEPIARFGELNSFRARLRVISLFSVRRASATTAPPATKAPRPIIESGEIAKEMSLRLISAFHGQETVLIGETVVPVLNFEINGGDSLRELPLGSRRVTLRSFVKCESGWIVNGTVEIASGRQPSEYDFVMNWSVSKNTWTVDSIVFRFR